MPLQPFERPHFFSGKLLTAEDLQREQDYHRGKARLLNRFVHGWGVVHGLRVTGDGETVVISPGLALDCVGNELVLAQPAQLSLSGCAPRLWVVIRYIEIPVGQIPTPNGNAAPSGIRESVVVELSRGNPSASHADRTGCGEDHALCLAAVRRRGTRWKVEPFKRSARRCR